MRAIWIRADRETVDPAEFGNAAELRSMVGGWIELARSWENGDTLYVDEDGLSKITTASRYFTIEGGHQPFAGNGVIVGREPPDEEISGDWPTTADPTITVDEVRAIVVFRTHAQLLAWARGNSSEPAVSLTMPGRDGGGDNGPGVRRPTADVGR